jgi:hypothetical protein
MNMIHFRKNESMLFRLHNINFLQRSKSQPCFLVFKHNSMKQFKFSTVFCVLFLTAFSFGKIYSQSNPGYLGKTQLVEVNVLTEWGRLLSYNSTVVASYGLSYEMARTKNFGVLFGFRTSTQKRYADGYDPEFYIESIDEYLRPREAVLPSGKSMDYLSFTNNELYVQFKRYNTTKGALAPFGTYWGLELSGSQLSTKDDRLRYQYYEWPDGYVDYAVNKSTRSVLAFIPSAIFGSRQMITDDISLNVYMGIGTVIFHNSTNMTIYDEYVDSDKEVVDYMMLRPVAAGRLFTAGFNLGYFF